MLMKCRNPGCLRFADLLCALFFLTCQIVVADDTTKLDRSANELNGLRKDVRALRDDVRRLSDLLEKRLASREQPTPASRAGKYSSPLEEQDATEAKIRATLLKPVSLDFQDTPLRDVLSRMGQLIDVNVVVDESSLEEEGRKLTDSVSINVNQISARSALKLILTPLNLTYLVQDEVLKILSVERAKGDLYTTTYSVAHLIPFLPDGKAKSPTNTPAEVQYTDALKTLRQLILQTISPDSWEETGGRGSIQSFVTTCSLVVRQTKDVHAEIVDLLQQIQRLKRLPQRSIKNDDPTPITATYAVADLVTPIANEQGDRMTVGTTDWLKLIDRITAEVKPHHWKSNGGTCSIQAFEKTLSLVTQAPHNVHEAIAELLSGLRRDQDIQVTIAVRFLSIPSDAKLLIQAGRGFEFDPRTNMTRIDESEAKQLITAHREGQGNLLVAPKITIFNGQIANIGSSESPEDEMPKFQLHVRGKVTEDRRSVRLNVALNPQSLVNDLVNNSYIMNDGGFLLIDMTERIAAAKRSSNKNDASNLTPEPNEEKSSVPSSKPKSRTFVLIQPRIIIEEEEQLAAPLLRRGR